MVPYAYNAVGIVQWLSSSTNSRHLSSVVVEEGDTSFHHQQLYFATMQQKKRGRNVVSRLTDSFEWSTDGALPFLSVCIEWLKISQGSGCNGRDRYFAGTLHVVSSPFGVYSCAFCAITERVLA
eukprot:scaffold2004_cov101-Cylindrotheca_fusiformis.AAC.1